MRTSFEAGRARSRTQVVAQRVARRPGWGCGFELLVTVLWLLGTTATVRAQLDESHSRIVLSSDSAAVTPPPGKAAVIFVRECYPRRDGFPDEAVLVDSGAAGVLPQRTWFALPVDPGDHVVWGIHQGYDLVLDCRPRRLYLLRLRERIDDKDEVVREWLRDDPAGLNALITQYGLKHAATTPNGFTWIADQQAHLAHSQAPGPEDHGLAGLAPRVFEHLLSERPLDRLNLDTDFSYRSGRLMVDSAAVHYRLRERVRSSFTSWAVVTDTLDIEAPQLMRIRLGGTRFTGITPWVDIVYRSPRGPRIASFADADERIALTTYNRLFAVLDDLLGERRQPRADVSGVLR